MSQLKNENKFAQKSRMNAVIIDSGRVYVDDLTIAKLSGVSLRTVRRYIDERLVDEPGIEVHISWYCNVPENHPKRRGTKHRRVRLAK